MKKKYLFLGIMVFLLMLTVGCAMNKEAISTSEFVEIATSKGYETIDITDRYVDYDQVKEATKISEEGFDIEFYVLNSTSDAKEMYEKNKKILDDNKDGMSTDTTVTSGNYVTYDLKTTDNYIHLCQVDNTMLYVNVESGYQNKTNELIDELGY